MKEANVLFLFSQQLEESFKTDDDFIYFKYGNTDFEVVLDDEAFVIDLKKNNKTIFCEASLFKKNGKEWKKEEIDKSFAKFLEFGFERLFWMLEDRREKEEQEREQEERDRQESERNIKETEECLNNQLYNDLRYE